MTEKELEKIRKAMQKGPVLYVSPEQNEALIVYGVGVVRSGENVIWTAEDRVSPIGTDALSIKDFYTLKPLA